jgi:hypothetical protein
MVSDRAASWPSLQHTQPLIQRTTPDRVGADSHDHAGAPVAGGAYRLTKVRVDARSRCSDRVTRAPTARVLLPRKLVRKHWPLNPGRKADDTLADYRQCPAHVCHSGVSVFMSRCGTSEDVVNTVPVHVSKIAEP